ncbi:hypothetical protein TGPRC2_362940 [Toxoplasma gondii TgCatPRC2]|uniref:Uncharacterized protein n=1 Tax=Toxoplasma gondii TgCatPRC2 TaxID=1130821 RepID=A0A151HAW9_TOXGO|nr:hypothetical protein TGPRC2_362940 [Toxoplasma gondii TgCatPRC2]
MRCAVDAFCRLGVLQQCSAERPSSSSERGTTGSAPCINHLLKPSSCLSEDTMLELSPEFRREEPLQVIWGFPGLLRLQLRRIGALRSLTGARTLVLVANTMQVGIQSLIELTWTKQKTLCRNQAWFSSSKSGIRRKNITPCNTDEQETLRCLTYSEIYMNKD